MICPMAARSPLDEERPHVRRDVAVVEHDQSPVTELLQGDVYEGRAEREVPQRDRDRGAHGRAGEHREAEDAGAAEV